MLINKNIYINFDLLEKTIRNFYELTHLQIGVWDSDGNVFFGHPQINTEFCTKVNIELRDRKYCHRCDEFATFKCNETLAPYSYICHAGAHELVVPLVFEGKCRMYVVFGQCVCTEKEAEQRATLRKYCEHKNIPVQDMERAFDKLPRYSQNYLKALADLAFLSFQAMWNDHTIEIRKDDILMQIDEYIYKNISGDLSIKNICNTFHLSKNTLYMLFNEYNKMTVNHYITLKRLEIAKHLLTSSDLTIAQISEKVGKKNYNDFIQTFKKYELISPYKYRQLHKIK